MKKLLKTIISISLCFSIGVLNFCSVKALDNKTNQSVEPRGMDVFTVAHDRGIPNGSSGSISWTATITYNSTSRTYTLTKMSYVTHFSYSTPTWSLSSYSTTPKVGGLITGDYIIIDYQVHTVGNVYIQDSFNFRV